VCSNSMPTALWRRSMLLLISRTGRCCSLRNSPGLMHMIIQEHLLAPFFCFQTFCVALWALDDYW
jgi:hypothetical protein